jgi:hypothetical protein
MASSTRVFSWVGGPHELSQPPAVQPAVRAWGDVIIELVADRSQIRCDPPVTIRSTALFAWTTPLPPEHLSQLTAQRTRLLLEVDGSRCATARVDLIDPMFDPYNWRRLAEHLTDLGFERDYVEEEIVTVTEPLAAMRVDGARAAVESTGADLLEGVLAYFERGVVAYLATWATLGDAPPGEVGDWEIVVPPDAVLAVGSDKGA